MFSRELFASIISTSLNENCTVISYSNLSGGCIHRVFKLTTTLGEFCVKVNNADKYDMFHTEHKDLTILRNTGIIKIPKVLGEGKIDNNAYILMEYITSGGRKSDYWERLGENIALLHQTSALYFGLNYDNYIGALPQSNSQKESWSDFYIHNRLEIQLKQGLASGRLDNNFARKLNLLYPRLKSLLIEEKPSLLHGDLWSGNVITNENGLAALIDPSVYYGSREVEIAFTTLFGGFEKAFYDAYQNALPLEKGFSERREIYLLYPLMVHCNLFGGGYRREAESIIDRFI